MRPDETKTIAYILGTAGTGMTNGETGSAEIDTYGFRWASIDLVLGTANTTSNKPSVMRLLEADSSAYSNAATVAVGGTDFTIPSCSTSVANLFRFEVDLRGRKRYLYIDVSPRTTMEGTVLARLSRGENVPDTTTEAGVRLVHRI